MTPACSQDRLAHRSYPQIATHFVGTPNRASDGINTFLKDW